MSQFINAFRRLARGQEFWSGVIFVLVGAFCLAVGLGYRIGSTSQMGPGYFPVALSAILIALGALVLVQSTAGTSERVDFGSLRPLLVVVGCVVLFALLIQRAGLFATSALVVFVASFSSHDVRPLQAALLALCLAVFSVVLFVHLLKQPMSVWP